MRALLENPPVGRVRSRLPGRLAARRQGAARMEDDAERGRIGGPMLWGSLSRLGLAVALATVALDQASKLWVIHGLQITPGTSLRIAPFLDFVLVWNKG